MTRDCLPPKPCIDGCNGVHLNSSCINVSSRVTLDKLGLPQGATLTDTLNSIIKLTKEAYNLAEDKVNILEEISKQMYGVDDKAKKVIEETNSRQELQAKYDKLLLSYTDLVNTLKTANILPVSYTFEV